MTEITPGTPELPGMEVVKPVENQDPETQGNINIGIEPSPNIGPDGKIIPSKRRKRTQNGEAAMVKTPVTPSRLPDNLLKEIRRRPMRERADIGPLHNTEPKKK